MSDEMEDITVAIDNVKESVFEMCRGDISDITRFDYLMKIGNSLGEILDNALVIEYELERQTKMASELRVQFGKELAKACDEAGIE